MPSTVCLAEMDRESERGRVIDSLEFDLLIFQEGKTGSCVFKG